MRRIAAAMMVMFALPGLACAQDGFCSLWNQQVQEAMETQPHWTTPLATTSAELTQRYRGDFTRQITSSGTATWNYGSGKGLNLIPWHRLEIDLNPPPYIQHNSPVASDGIGDFSMMGKFRIASGNAEHGAYAVSASLGGTFPTGSFNNGSPRGAVIPTIYGGKGFGPFDLQSSLGASLPTSDAEALGRPVAWNVVGQYRLAGVLRGVTLWPEIENNATFYHGGPNDGRKQNFVTLGMMVNGIQLSSTPGSRLRMTFGAGMQIATTHFHTYNHALILSTRFNF